jgi:DNA-binding MarR family transcriptional regulator
MFEEQEIDFHDLSKKVDLKTGTLTPIVNNLKQSGYIDKITNKDDKRKVNIALTEKGAALKKEVVSVPLQMAKELEIDEDMYKILVKELDDLKEILTQAQAKL